MAEKAIRELWLAIDLGYVEVARAKVDEDLTVIREQHPHQWTGLIKTMEERLAVTKLKKVEEEHKRKQHVQEEAIMAHVQAERLAVMKIKKVEEERESTERAAEVKYAQLTKKFHQQQNAEKKRENREVWKEDQFHQEELEIEQQDKVVCQQESRLRKWKKEHPEIWKKSRGGTLPGSYREQTTHPCPPVESRPLIHAPQLRAPH